MGNRFLSMVYVRTSGQKAIFIARWAAVIFNSGKGGGGGGGEGGGGGGGGGGGRGRETGMGSSKKHTVERPPFSWLKRHIITTTKNSCNTPHGIQGSRIIISMHHLPYALHEPRTDTGSCSRPTAHPSHNLLQKGGSGQPSHNYISFRECWEI